MNNCKTGLFITSLIVFFFTAYPASLPAQKSVPAETGIVGPTETYTNGEGETEGFTEEERDEILDKINRGPDAVDDGLLPAPPPKGSEMEEVRIIPSNVPNLVKEHPVLQEENIDSVEDIKLQELDTGNVYKVSSIRKARLFFIFPVKVSVTITLDAETGEVVNVKKPWWNFLAW